MRGDFRVRGVKVCTRRLGRWGEVRVLRIRLVRTHYFFRCCLLRRTAAEEETRKGDDWSFWYAFVREYARTWFGRIHQITVVQVKKANLSA